ncbi:MAG TPA: hypothetical protein VNF68_01800 [Candidatus Baltobacteraceae bacterium]|nr:hypothetical protein [Candidatus Baltobacteraceae bacterium]
MENPGFIVPDKVADSHSRIERRHMGEATLLGKPIAIRTIASIALGALLLVPMVARADDAGPAADVRDIRQDLPVILASRSQPDVVVVDSVAVSGDQALVQAHTSDGPVVYAMTRYLDSWWYKGTIRVGPHDASACWKATASAIDSNGVTPQLLRNLGLPDALVDVAQHNLPLVIKASERALQQDGSRGKPWIRCDYTDGLLSFSEGRRASAGPYEITVLFGKNDATAGAEFPSVVGRAPDQGESLGAPPRSAYAFFSTKLTSATTVHVDAGTQLNVWFPFVLDASKTFSLTLTHVLPTIGSVSGTLKDNTLHFVLPPFAIAPGATLTGEIDGSPRDH